MSLPASEEPPFPRPSDHTAGKDKGILDGATPEPLWPLSWPGSRRRQRDGEQMSLNSAAQSGHPAHSWEAEQGIGPEPAGISLDFSPDSGCPGLAMGERRPPPRPAVAEEVGEDMTFMMTDRGGPRETQTLSVRDLSSRAPPRRAFSLFLCPSSTPAFFLIRNRLRSCVYLGGWRPLCLGIPLDTVLSCPHPADAWAGLYISGVAYLKHRLLFLEDYKCRGLGRKAWGPRAGVGEKLRGLNMVTVEREWREAQRGISEMVGKAR